MGIDTTDNSNKNIIKSSASSSSSSSSLSSLNNSNVPELYVQAQKENWINVTARASSHPEEVRFVDPKTGRTALHWACSSRKKLSTSTSTSSSSSSSSSSAAAAAAAAATATAARVACIRALLSTYPDAATLVDKVQGYTPLHYTCLINQFGNNNNNNNNNNKSASSSSGGGGGGDNSGGVIDLHTDEQVVKLILDFSPSSRNIVSPEDGRTALEIHIISYSAYKRWEADQIMLYGAAGVGGPTSSSSGSVGGGRVSSSSSSSNRRRSNESNSGNTHRRRSNDSNSAAGGNKSSTLVLAALLKPKMELSTTTASSGSSIASGSTAGDKNNSTSSTSSTSTSSSSTASLAQALELLYECNSSSILEAVALEEAQASANKLRARRQARSNAAAAAAVAGEGASISEHHSISSQPSASPSSIASNILTASATIGETLSNLWVWEWAIQIFKCQHFRKYGGKQHQLLHHHHQQQQQHAPPSPHHHHLHFHHHHQYQYHHSIIPPFSLVHSAAHIKDCCLPFLLLAMWASPSQLRTPDAVDGNLPLHIVASWDSASHAAALNSTDAASSIARKSMAISALLSQYPEASKVRNKQGKTPLSLALETGTSWDNGVRRLSTACS